MTILPMAIVAVLVLCAPSAFGAQTHPYTGVSFGPDGVGGSQSFQHLQALALDSSGNVYAYDPSAGKVYKFDEAGNPVNFSGLGGNAIEGVNGGGGGAEFGLATAPTGAPGGTAGDIYVATNGQAIQVYAPSGAKLGEIEQGGETCGVAVDPTGNLYAGVYGSTINRYTPDANPPTTANKSSATVEHGICNVAADGLGNVYAANYNGAGLFKLEGMADTTPVEVDPRANTMAIAPGSNDLYADRGDEVVQYDSSGSLIGNFGGDDISESHGVAVNSGATKIYAGTSSKVKVFGASVIVPDVTAEAATGISGKRATLHGVVNSAGLPVTSCEFEYGNGEGPNSKVPCEGSVPNDSNDHQVSAALTGLTPLRTYTFRLIASNANGGGSGSVVPFTTLATATTEPATDITASGAKLNGIVAPENEAVSQCYFEYGTIEFDDFSSTVPCTGAIPTDEQAHPVSAVISGLSRGTQYHFRLVTVQAGGTTTGSVRNFAPAGAAPLAEGVRAVGIDHATFTAEIDPRGVTTSYFFEYGASTAYGNTTPKGGPIAPYKKNGHPVTPVSVQQFVAGLAPGTTYHWRLVLVDSFGEGSGPDHTFTTQRPPSAPKTDCPNQAFREFAGASLPDCRAYEQASPVDKGGLNVEGFIDHLGASSDGSRFSFYSQAGSGIPASGGAHQGFTTMLSSRVGESWSTQRLTPPGELGSRGGFLGASADMRYALVEAGDWNTGAVHNGLYIIDTTDSSLATIVPYESNGESGETHPGEYGYDSISADGLRVFFETRHKLTDNAIAERDNLYMWERASGKVSLVGVLPGASEEAPPGGSFGGAYSWFYEPNTSIGGSLRGLYVEALHAISPDGDQAYFTAGETGQLYLRRGLTSSSPTTIHVSAPDTGVNDPNGPLPAAFQEATPDGSRAFFLSSQKLTADAKTGEFDEGKDLYRYDSETETLVDITPDSTDPNGAEVRGLLGASADGSSGYFVAKGVLTPEGVLGQNNIYRFSEDEGSFTFAFVARLNNNDPIEGSDAVNWSPQSNAGTLIEPEVAFTKKSRVTPDGKTLLFASQRSLTGFDNVGCGGSFNQGCQEIYVYSAGNESLICVSCNPTGESPIGGAQITGESINAFLIPDASVEGRLPRSLSTDGSRVFFQTGDSLVAADTNADAGCKYHNTIGNSIPDCLDAYEWEAPGAPGGSCHKAEMNGGCIYLLSSGKSRDASYFIDASTDSKSAFIATTSQLVPTDKDQLYDAYAVRTDGGLASQNVIPTPPCSSGEACHGSSSTPPQVSSPGTFSFQGPVNPKGGRTKAKKCRKSAHNHCGKKQHKKKHRKKNAKRPNATTKAGGSK